MNTVPQTREEALKEMLHSRALVASRHLRLFEAVGMCKISYTLELPYAGWSTDYNSILEVLAALTEELGYLVQLDFKDGTTWELSVSNARSA